MLDALRLIGGLVLLYFGAEWMVAGAARLGRSLGVSAILIGLTVVAYGTSAPEVVVSIEAALSGHSEIALGNVIGSNIANIALILGTTALVLPPRVDAALPRREVPVLVATAVALRLLLHDGTVATWEGALLLLGALLYTVWMIRTSSREVPEAAAGAEVTAEAAEVAAVAVPRVEVPKDAVPEAGAPGDGAPGDGAPGDGAPGDEAARDRTARARVKLSLLALVGLATLVVGGSVFVDGATGIARALGISERIVGLTIVAVGTSLPELATSLVAARRGHSDIAVGNVIGSNIFNILFCTGAAAVIGTVGAPLESLRFDLVVLMVVTLVAALMMRSARTITRGEGAVLLAGYVGYVSYLVVAG